MSYILDALKKLEHDKSRKSRKDGVINISGALFEHERPKPTGPTGWKITLLVAVAALAAFGAAWLLLRPAKGRVKPVPPPAVQLSQAPAAPQATAGSAPQPPVPPVIPVQQIPAATAATPVRATPVRPSALPSRQQETVVQAASADEEDDEGRESRRRLMERKGQSATVEQAGAAPGGITLSGIAWQEERRTRRAVVNGFLMREGEVVSGARITDIFQDRVRFSLSGKTFEIPLISSAVPAAGK
jgi:general secretion pathway protein B